MGGIGTHRQLALRLIANGLEDVPVADQDLCRGERALDGGGLGIRAVDHPLIALEADLAAEPDQEVV